MEDLCKHELILVALLVSFVTALATGIVTVSLMGQAPQGVTQTISKVIERTIQVAAAGDTNTNTKTETSFDTQISNAIDIISPSIVKIRSSQSPAVNGLGL